MPSVFVVLFVGKQKVFLLHQMFSTTALHFYYRSETRGCIIYYVLCLYSELHSADHIEKFKKYEADYTRWLTAKYFSKKTLYGGVQQLF